jgi:uncharacterized protein involved in exopolysaccharide biosynthesis
MARAELKPGATDTRLASFAGLAAQFGVGVGALGGVEGPEYYAAVLRSNQILGDVVRSSFSFSRRGLGEGSGDSAQGTLMDIWEVQGPTPAAREARAIRRLRASMTARPNLAAGLVRLEVTARWPGLAVQINRRFLQSLEAFNLLTRQSQAAAQRRFVERRLTDMRAELTAAEEALVTFESRNRLLQAPGLALERQRLQRRVDVSQQVYLTLAQGYEQARIDEVRDTPVITVVDAPENTVEESGGVLLFLLLGGLVGGLVGLGLILLSEIWTSQIADHPDDAKAIRAAWRLVPRRLAWRTVPGADRGTAS